VQNKRIVPHNPIQTRAATISAEILHILSQVFAEDMRSYIQQCSLNKQSKQREIEIAKKLFRATAEELTKVGEKEQIKC
jgi:hypothetical protein